MKKMSILFLSVVCGISLVACGKNMEETVSKAEHEAVLLELDATKSELRQLEKKLTMLTEELENAKTDLDETEEEEILESEATDDLEQKKEGFLVATEPIVVPDASLQSELVVELTTENFLSVFEYMAINQFDENGSYYAKVCGFSSLLYEQGWALGKLEEVEVNYSIFGKERTDTDLTQVKVLDITLNESDTDVVLTIYHAEGKATFYPIKEVSDETEAAPEYNVRVIRRTLPDGSVVVMYTDVDGHMVY